MNYQRPSMVARRQDSGEETFVSALDCVMLVKLDGGSNVTLNRDVLPKLQAPVISKLRNFILLQFRSETAWHPDTAQSASARNRARGLPGL